MTKLRPWLPLLFLHSFLFFFFLISFKSNAAKVSGNIGINYGQLGNNLPSPPNSVRLIQSLKAATVKIYDANPQILKSLAGTGIKVSIMIPDQIISNISASQSLSDLWIHSNLIPFFPATAIRYVLVGNEILSSFSGTDPKSWPDLVPAMRRIRRSLKTLNLTKIIKVGTPLAMDCLESSFPPSNGTFRSDISDPIIKPMLRFLTRHKSFFFVDSYPYFAWAADPTNINLDYVLFNNPKLTYTDPVSRLTYTNLLDQMLDALVFAMTKLGFPNVPIIIAETGWPTAGDFDQIGANIYNAAMYNRNLVRKMTAEPPVGTPARPGILIPTMIFALYNENQKPGPTTERNWGLLYPNGSHVYEIDLTGKKPVSGYEPLPKPVNNEPYRGKVWCVAASHVVANATKLEEAMRYACSQGNSTCDSIRPGGECYEPNSLVAHASYAFNSYWVQFRSSGQSCFFDGLAAQSTKDPSHGYCRFPSVTL